MSKKLKATILCTDNEDTDQYTTGEIEKALKSILINELSSYDYDIEDITVEAL